MSANLDRLKKAFRVFRLQKEERELVLQAVVVGAAAWAAIYVLKELVHWLFHEVVHWIEQAPVAIVLFVPLLLGAAIVAIVAGLRKVTVDYKDEEGHVETIDAVEGDGMERAIALYHLSNPPEVKDTKEKLHARAQLPTLSLALRKFVATLATLGLGGSGGLEASAALIGENLAAAYYKLRHRRSDPDSQRHRLWHSWAVPNSEHLQVAQLSGIAAGVTALLGAPISSAFFATEIMYHNRPLLGKFFYSLISALVAQIMSYLVLGELPALFEVAEYEPAPATLHYVAFLFLTVLTIAFVGQIFRTGRLKVVTWFERRSKRWARLLLGAIVTGLVAYGVVLLTRPFVPVDTGLLLVLGSGESAVNMAFAGELTLILALIGLAAKLVATLATISSGGSAGLLVPTLFFGSMVAVVFANLGGLPDMTLIVPALTASLVAIVNTPLAALLLVIELFGVSYVAPTVLALLVTYLLSHPKTIYRTQQSYAKENRPVHSEREKD